jgi:arylsulfatase A-like enzyme
MNLVKKNIYLLAILIVLVVLLLSQKNKSQNSQIPCQNCNIIIVAYDALQANHVFHLGYTRDTTPKIDEFAKNGITFTNTISQASWTVPSYMSIFTSLYPSEHKLVNKFVKFTQAEKIISNFSQLSPNLQTLAQVFKENGYITGGFTGDAGVNSQFGYNQGFDAYYDGDGAFSSVEKAGEKALEWLKGNKGKKFFMFLHGYDSHGQFKMAEDSYFRYYSADMSNSSKYRGTPQDQAKLREEGLAKGKLNLSDEEVAFWRLVYDSKIRDADDRVAKFFEEFDKLGVSDKTIVIVLSDHGTEFYEHQRFDHGHTLYDELVHVPLVISGPNLPKGKRVDNQVRLIDVAPTIIDLLGLKTTDQYQSQIRGKSLLNLIDGKEDEPRDAFMETDYRNYTHKRGIRTADGWKYILTMDTGEKELYHLKDDPSESKNVYNDNLKLAYELDTKLKKHLQDMGTDIDGPWDKDCLPVYGEICQ